MNDNVLDQRSYATFVIPVLAASKQKIDGSSAAKNMIVVSLCIWKWSYKCDYLMQMSSTLPCNKE